VTLKRARQLSSEVREHLVELIDFGEIGRSSRFEAFRTAGPRPWPGAAAASMLALESIARFESTEVYPAWSPDDRWLAHASNATGRYEIYVQPYPGLGTAIPVSTNGGVAPAWNPQGNELFYVEGRRGLYVMDDQRMMSVDMTNPAAAAKTGGSVFILSARLASCLRIPPLPIQSRRVARCSTRCDCLR
jgi:hypothetical protein